MPALIVSTAAGLMVSKAGVEGSTDKALIAQLSFYPQALGMVATVMGIVAVLPGMPTLVFAALSAGTGALAWGAYRQEEQRPCRRREARRKVAHRAAPEEEPISTALALDPLRIELGYGLLPLDQRRQGPPHHRPDQGAAPAARPGNGLRDAAGSHPRQHAARRQRYCLRVKEVDAGRGELFPGSMLVMDPKGAPIDLPGTHTTEPAFGLPATWIAQTLREEASFRGLTVVDPGTVLTTHLTEVLKTNMSELLSYSETKKLLDDLPAEQKKLVEELMPSQIQHHGRPARAADAARRARLDPRPALDPRRHRRSRRPHQEHALHHGACAGAPVAPAQPSISGAGRLSADRGAVARLGTGFRGIHRRPGRRPPARHGPVAAAAVHPDDARAFRRSLAPRATCRCC